MESEYRSESHRDLLSSEFLNFLVQRFNERIKEDPEYPQIGIKRGMFDNPNFSMDQKLNHAGFFQNQFEDFLVKKESSGPYVSYENSYYIIPINTMIDYQTSTINWQYEPNDDNDQNDQNDQNNDDNDQNDDDSDDNNEDDSNDSDDSDDFIQYKRLSKYNKLNGFNESQAVNITPELKVIEECHNNSRLISASEKISMEFIQNNPQYNWNWHMVSENPNLTIQFILANLDKPFCWETISQNNSITIDDVIKHPELSWNYYKLSKNRHLTMEFVLKNQDKHWDLFQLANHEFSYNEENYKEKQTEIIKNTPMCIPQLSGLLAKYV